MKGIWTFLDGKKTAIGAVIFLVDTVIKASDGEVVDMQAVAASVMVLWGLSHKAVKTKGK